MAHGQQHEDAARIGHGVERRGRERGHAVDGAGRQAEGLQLRCDDRQRDELAGGRAAGEHAHERHDDPADEDRRDADARDGVDHGLKRLRVGEHASEAADGGDGHRHGHGVHCAAVEHGLEILMAQLRPEQCNGQRDGAQQADVDVELPDVEQQEEHNHREEGDDQLRLAAGIVIARVKRVELKVLAAFAGTVDEQVHDDEDRGDLGRRAHESGHQRHVGRRAEHGHGGHVRDLRAAGHGQREGERAGAQNAEDEFLRDIAALENDQRDGVHEHDDDAGDDTAEVEDGADDQNDGHGDEVFAGAAHVLLEQEIHNGVGDGVGGAALRVDL